MVPPARNLPDVRTVAGHHGCHMCTGGRAGRIQSTLGGTAHDAVLNGPLHGGLGISANAAGVRMGQLIIGSGAA